MTPKERNYSKRKYLSKAIKKHLQALLISKVTNKTADSNGIVKSFDFTITKKMKNNGILHIFFPNSCSGEKLWVIRILFKEFLGLEYVAETQMRNDICIERNNKYICMPDTFFSLAESNWLKESTLPGQPLRTLEKKDIPLNIEKIEPILPIIYGTKDLDISAKKITLGLDVIGSSFFMLSRYEEIVNKDRDSRNRFPSTASLAYQEGFLSRPIVNEYLEILWACIQYLWPDLRRKEREFNMKISVDVDHAYDCAGQDLLRQVKRLGVDLINKRPKEALQRLLNYFNRRREIYSYDPYYNNLFWIMEVNEEVGNKVVFYFIAGHSDIEKDGCYTLDDPNVRNVMMCMYKRGHEIGLHPSYNTFESIEQMSEEANNLRRAMVEEKIANKELRSRQHYLRWNPVITPQIIKETGISFDSTLAYADCAGFRCGVCYEYEFYDLISRKEAGFIESPLVVMERTIFSDSEIYMRLCVENGVSKIEELKQKCRIYNGDFTLLWHNTTLQTPLLKEAYKKVVSKSYT
jgi:Family of unknown function (DUF7033)